MTKSRMFHHIVQAQLTELRATAQDAADRERRLNEEEARMDEPLTRREVLSALETVRDHFGGSGEPVQEAIYDAIDRLRDALS